MEPFTDQDILRRRPAKNAVDPRKPYAFLVEPECTACGDVEEVATIFLTNRECPFRCLMCDLWKNTTDTSVGPGAIPAQIDFALRRLPTARHIKLYNSGNFFDHRAIDPTDYRAIAERVAGFDTVIVENHPNLCGDDCLRFQEMIDGRLEIALGLETIHPEALALLNKRMTVDDFGRAAEFLRRHDIDIRAFVLLRPPLLSESEGVDWAIRTLQFAWNAGAGCCSVIPVRAGNGIMEELSLKGHFAPPSMASIERVQAAGLQMERGRVFVDLWDCQQFYPCSDCGPRRQARMERMNLRQNVEPSIGCDCQALGRGNRTD